METRWGVPRHIPGDTARFPDVDPPESPLKKSCLQALPACVRAPWEVFHEECVKHKTRVLRDLSARDAYAAFGVLNAQTRFQYASVSTDELASYLYYRDIMFQVRKPDNWGELSCDERDDFMPNNVWMFLTDLVRREPEASILMPELDFSFVLQGMPAEPGPLLGWERLEPAVLEVFQALASKLPLALGASLGPVLARLQLKKEEQQEPARELDQQSCLDIERQLLRPYVSEQVPPCMLCSSVSLDTHPIACPGEARRAHVLGDVAPQPRAAGKRVSGRTLG